MCDHADHVNIWWLTHSGDDKTEDRLWNWKLLSTVWGVHPSVLACGGLRSLPPGACGPHGGVVGGLGHSGGFCEVKLRFLGLKNVTSISQDHESTNSMTLLATFSMSSRELVDLATSRPTKTSWGPESSPLVLLRFTSATRTSCFVCSMRVGRDRNGKNGKKSIFI